MLIFAEVTEKDSVNDRHLRDNKYIQFGPAMTKVAKGLPLIFRPKLTTPCSAFSLRQLSCLSRLYNLTYLCHVMLRIGGLPTLHRLLQTRRSQRLFIYVMRIGSLMIRAHLRAASGRYGDSTWDGIELWFSSEPDMNVPTLAYYSQCFRQTRRQCMCLDITARTRTSYGDRGFFVHGLEVWNGLSHDLWSTDILLTPSG